MPNKGAHWWMYAVTFIYVCAFLFNARQEAWGPANAGWTPSWPTLQVAGVTPGGPMDKAGLRAGDVLEAADGLRLTGMPDWFAARAQFERDRPIEMQIRRGEQHLLLQIVIEAPAFRTWNKTQASSVVALYLARFLLLLLAILVAFSRPRQLSARLAALALAIGAVAEGYPSSGWAAALRHLPGPLAVPIGLASVSCLLAPAAWLAFCASFPRPQLSHRWRWDLVLLPIVVFGVPMVASAIAMIYAPAALARPWPILFSEASVRLIEDVGGVTPLLFINVWPRYGPMVNVRLLELWLLFVVLYFALGFLLLLANYRRADDRFEKRQIRALGLTFLLFGFIVLHNVFMRNWTAWFGSAAPAVFSGGALVAEAVLFPIVPLTLAYCVLAKPAAPPSAKQRVGFSMSKP